MSSKWEKSSSFHGHIRLAAHERRQDLAWVSENFHIFWLAATEAFAEQGERKD